MRKPHIYKKGGVWQLAPAPSAVYHLHDYMQAVMYCLEHNRVGAYENAPLYLPQEADAYVYPRLSEPSPLTTCMWLVAFIIAIALLIILALGGW